MYTTGTNIGEYLDPAMVDSAFTNNDLEPWPNQSWESGAMGLVDVPLADGRTAIVDSNGIIVGFR